jgi:hypothetical protein
MKNIFIIVLFVLSGSSYSQKVTNLLVDSNFNIRKASDSPLVYECILKIHNQTNSDDDYYKFNVNLGVETDFEKAGVEVSAPAFMDSEKLYSMLPCDLHNILSDQGVYIFRKTEDNKILRWTVMYMGTYRNLTFTREQSRSR